MVDLSDEAKAFLLELFEKTSGDLSGQVSMYDIGQAVGLDRDAAGRIGEELMGWELVEVRTLAGGIGITETGRNTARKMGAGPGGSDNTSVRLGTAPILEDPARQAVDSAAAQLKTRAGDLGADFNRVSELIADIKTIDAQLASPMPKTAIIRECFRSICAVLEKIGAEEALAPVRTLLDE